ncbi:MAG: DegT/DnrJ/EryC1/StrS family aminotransferase [Alphaproteobacteria bacterium]|nr:DegT/DnrJ/EryC1/StrS family aminotransferase [Alphaproteobacteria bacterium]
MSIPFIDLQAQRRRLGRRIDDAILKVVNHGAYILGPEVQELETKLAQFCGARHCVSCANGTDALALVLMAWGIKPGDAVYVPAFTFVATAEVVAWLGATPVFVDVLADTFNMDPESLEAAIEATAHMKLTPRAVIPVDLFGQPADYRRLLPIAERHGLRVLCDTAQGLGATLDGRHTGTFGDATATSFFPAKPLACYGEGGAIFTDDDALAEDLHSLRVHGQGRDKYDNVRIGMNGRLDTIQAAVLIEKLEIFPDEIAARQRAADYYSSKLDARHQPPVLMDGATSVWAQYTIQLDGRDGVQDACRSGGVPTAIYYPIPLARQTGYRHYPTVPGGTPVSEALAHRVLSLPMHPYLDRETQDRILALVTSADSVSAAATG